MRTVLRRIPRRSARLCAALFDRPRRSSSGPSGSVRRRSPRCARATRRPYPGTSPPVPSPGSPAGCASAHGTSPRGGRSGELRVEVLPVAVASPDHVHRSTGAASKTACRCSRISGNSGTVHSPLPSWCSVLGSAPPSRASSPRPTTAAPGDLARDAPAEPGQRDQQPPFGIGAASITLVIASRGRTPCGPGSSASRLSPRSAGSRSIRQRPPGRRSRGRS